MNGEQTVEEFYNGVKVTKMRKCTREKVQVAMVTNKEKKN